MADIVRSIKDAINTGEYKDPTGIAERQEVNAEEAEQIRQHKVSEDPFYSNAMKAVENIKQEKATPEMKESVMQEQPMFFKTADGQAYGFTYQGKIYVDPKIATSEAPIHEYGHLWCDMKRKTDPKEWNEIKNVMLTDDVVKLTVSRSRWISSAGRIPPPMTTSIHGSAAWMTSRHTMRLSKKNP